MRETATPQRASTRREPVDTDGVSRATGPEHGPIRMAAVLDLVGVGGAETLLLNLFRAFDPAVVTPRLVCLREAGPLAERFRASGFAVEVVDRAGPFDPRRIGRL